MTVTPEDLCAFADSQLPPDEAARIGALVEADPALRRRVDRMRAAAAALKGAFDGVLKEDVPPALAALVAAPRRAATPPRAWRGPPVWAAAMAACLLVAFGLGRLSAPSPDIVAAADGRVAAAGALARALDRTPSGAETATVRIDLSFTDADGGHCRMFRTSGKTPLSGLACGRASDWRIVALTEGADAGKRGYALAAGDLSPSIAMEASARRIGDPLDAAQERAAIAAGWRAEAR